MVTASASSSAGGQQGALSVCSQGNKQLSNCQLLQSLGNVPDSYTRIFIFSKVTNVWEGDISDIDFTYLKSILYS